MVVVVVGAAAAAAAQSLRHKLIPLNKSLKRAPNRMLTSKLHHPSRLISFNINKGKTTIFGAYYHSFASHLGQVYPPDNPPRNLINLTGHDAPHRWSRSALEQMNSPTEEVTFWEDSV